MCGIARFVMSLNQNPAYTLATQWLERSLDDSSNKRLSIPEAFLGTDALLNLLSHLLTTLTAETQISLKKVEDQAFYFMLENVLMASSIKGGDRQELHEKLRKLAMHAKAKKDPLSFLIQSIEKDPDYQLTSAECKKLHSMEALIGRAPKQVEEFLKSEVLPFLRKHKGKKASIPLVEM
jgi:adenylosuccinate lyase